MGTIFKHNVLLFGITGGTGSLIAQQLLETGNRVIAVARRPEMVSLKHDNLQIVQGDILKPRSYAALIKHCDVVISAVGDRSGKPTSLYSEGIDNVIGKMKTAGCNRLICISACPVEISPEVVFWLRWLMKYVVQKTFKNGYADLRIMEQRIKASDLNWTIVRPPMLTDKPARDKYKTGVNVHLRKPFSIARADLANYIAGIIDKPETFKSIVEIAY